MAVLESTPFRRSNRQAAAGGVPQSRPATSPPAPSVHEQLFHLLLDGEIDGPGRRQTIEQIAGIVLRHTNAVGIVYCDHDHADTWRVVHRLFHEDGTEFSSVDDSDWTARCEAAARAAGMHHGLIGGRTRGVAISMPVTLRSGEADAFCALFCCDRLPTQRCIEALQLASTYFTLWHLWNAGDGAGSLADESAGGDPWLEKIAAAATFQDAALTVVNHSPARLGCDRAAFGSVGRAGTCRLIAMSGVAKFDRRTAYVRAIEGAFAETIASGGTTSSCASHDAADPQTSAHSRLAEVAGARLVCSTPILDQDFAVVGVWLLLGSDEAALPHWETCIDWSLAPLGAALGRLRAAERKSPVRQVKSLAAQLRKKPAALAAAAVVLLIAAMFFPISYQLKCDCVVEPLTKRFVTAPYDGTLKRSLVRPGALVKSGDLLALMDDRDIRWELAGLEADLSRAKKRRDAAMAGRKTSDSQLAALEVDRLQAKLQLLRDRLDEAQIRSPLDGMVVGGDPQQAEGGPLEIGRTLFEVAPLDGMIVEAAVPENEIVHVRPGMEVQISLDSLQNSSRQGVVKRMHPSSEIREHDNVFVVEVALGNDDQTYLKPGMNGRAKIVCDRRSIGWILFHRAAAAVGQAIGW